jgi:hypothetical protein
MVATRPDNVIILTGRFCCIPKSFKDTIEAGLIYLKNYRERLR